MEYIRTDLALENRERFKSDNVEVKGVELIKEKCAGGKIEISRVIIKNKEGAGIMGKPEGTYVTLEGAVFLDDEIVGVITDEIRAMLPKKEKLLILVVGLGNREVTPDALGPMVVDKLDIMKSMREKESGNSSVELCAVVPGVMAQSGMESAGMVRGIIREIGADAVIAIDSLAARNVKRLNSVIQISDTGIAPGSGVGNHRYEMTGKSLKIPVIAVGVPLVVNAATIVNDAIERLLNSMEELSGAGDSIRSVINPIKGFSQNERYSFVSEIIEPIMLGMFVTPDCVDESVKRMSTILAAGINSLIARN